MQSVVKIFTQTCSPNFSLPWQQKPVCARSGSGFAISNKRILTNAHVIADQTSIRIHKNYDPEKYTAHVIHVAHECEIAILGVDDDKFWKGLEPLEFGGIPERGDEVDVIGFPEGGDNVSVTRGVVSRVDGMNYEHSGWYFLTIQIDAAINRGNSGGPVTMDGNVVGIAFQGLDEAENIGYIVPMPVINHFLEDIERNGHYSGFCKLGIWCADIESKHMRKYLQLAEDETGVLISKVAETSCCNQKLLPGDVLMAINGMDIACNGTVPFRGQERIFFRHFVSMAFLGDTIDATVLRAGKKLSVTIVAKIFPELVPEELFDTKPSYVVYSGLVFTNLSQPYLRDQYDDWLNDAPVRLNNIVSDKHQKKEDETVVILSQVLPSEITIGYEHLVDYQLFSVNGISVLNLVHLCHLLDQITMPHTENTENASPTGTKSKYDPLQNSQTNDDVNHVEGILPTSTDVKGEADKLSLRDENDLKVEFIRFELHADTVIVLEIKSVLENEDNVLDTYGIGQPRSADLPPQMF